MSAAKKTPGGSAAKAPTATQVADEKLLHTFNMTRALAESLGMTSAPTADSTESDERVGARRARLRVGIKLMEDHVAAERLHQANMSTGLNMLSAPTQVSLGTLMNQHGAAYQQALSVGHRPVEPFASTLVGGEPPAAQYSRLENEMMGYLLYSHQHGGQRGRSQASSASSSRSTSLTKHARSSIAPPRVSLGSLAEKRDAAYDAAVKAGMARVKPYKHAGAAPENHGDNYLRLESELAAYRAYLRALGGAKPHAHSSTSPNVKATGRVLNFSVTTEADKFAAFDQAASSFASPQRSSASTAKAAAAQFKAHVEYMQEQLFRDVKQALTSRVSLGDVINDVTEKYFAKQPHSAFARFTSRNQPITVDQAKIIGTLDVAKSMHAAFFGTASSSDEQPWSFELYRAARLSVARVRRSGPHWISDRRMDRIGQALNKAKEAGVKPSQREMWQCDSIMERPLHNRYWRITGFREELCLAFKIFGLGDLGELLGYMEGFRKGCKYDVSVEQMNEDCRRRAIIGSHDTEPPLADEVGAANAAMDDKTLIHVRDPHTNSESDSEGEDVTNYDNNRSPPDRVGEDAPDSADEAFVAKEGATEEELQQGFAQKLAATSARRLSSKSKAALARAAGATHMADLPPFAASTSSSSSSSFAAAVARSRITGSSRDDSAATKKRKGGYTRDEHQQQSSGARQHAAASSSFAKLGKSTRLPTRVDAAAASDDERDNAGSLGDDSAASSPERRQSRDEQNQSDRSQNFRSAHIRAQPLLELPAYPLQFFRDQTSADRRRHEEFVQSDEGQPPQDPNTFRVRMMSASSSSSRRDEREDLVSGRTKLGLTVSIRRFTPRTHLTPRAWLTAFHTFIRQIRLPEDQFVEHLAHLQANQHAAKAIQAEVKRSDESDYEFYARVSGNFIREHSPSDTEVRSYQTMFRSMHIGIRQDINDFIEQFEKQFLKSYPDENMHSRVTFDQLMESLDADFARNHRTYVWSPANSDAETLATLRERNAGGVPVTSWRQLVGLATSYYLNRARSDIIAGEDAAIERNHAPPASARFLARTEYQGTHSALIADRSRRAGNDNGAFNEVPPTASDQRAYNRRNGHDDPAPRRSTTESSASRSHNQPRRARRIRKGDTPSDSDSVEASESDPEQPPAKIRRTHAITRTPEPAKKDTAPRRDSNQRAEHAPAPTGTLPDDTIVCPDCCLSHPWERCVRNARGQRPNPAALKHQASGPHYKAADNMKDLVLRLYGHIGVARGSEPTRVNGPVKAEQRADASPLSNAARSQVVDSSGRVRSFRIRIAANGGVDIVQQGDVGRVHNVGIFCDTGSQVSLISYDWWLRNRACLGELGPIPTFKLVVADGTIAPVRGTVWLTVRIRCNNTGRYFSRQFKFNVVEGLDEPVLAGLDLLKAFYRSLNLFDGSVTLRGDLRSDAVAKDTSNEQHTYAASAIRVTRQICLKPRSIMRVEVSYDPQLSALGSVPILCEATPLHSKSDQLVDITFPAHVQDLSQATATAPHRSTYHLLVQNNSREAVQLNAEDVIGQATAVADEDDYVPQLEPTNVRVCRVALSTTHPSRAHLVPASRSLPADHQLAPGEPARM